MNKNKNFLYLSIIVVGMSILGCNSTSVGVNSGELIGVPGRQKWFEPVPHGMVFVPSGNLIIGQNDEDVSWALNSQSKTVSLGSFWMDETEITNNEYRQFVHWVKDSVMRTILGEQFEDYLIQEDQDGNPIDPPILNKQISIDYTNPEIVEALQEVYYSDNDKLYGNRELDIRKLNYKYFWVDIKQAAQKTNRFNYKTKEYEGYVYDLKGDRKAITGRSSFIMKDEVNVYPDTLCWVADFTYSFNEPYVDDYFSHPGFDEYPVVGVTWKQATAFCIWRTSFLNGVLKPRKGITVSDYRLPSETEWEYAARGGLQLSPYPWGGPYTRNDKGCFLANFKPLRGNYAADGGITTTPVGSYSPNDFNLYDMSGNVAEWTSSAFNESSYNFIHDMNPDYKYNSRPDDPKVMKRKSIRGGSWKDIARFLQVGTRSYEYEYEAKSYIGFRCVRTSILGSY